MPLGHIAAVRHCLKRQLLPVIFLHIAQRLIDDKASGVMGLLILCLLIDSRHFLQPVHHDLEGFPDLIHF